MQLLTKFKWLLIVAIVFALVLATNLIDKRIFRNINESSISIYEDRLVVKNVILDMVTAINQKEVAFLTRDTAFIATNNEALTNALKNDLQLLENRVLLDKEEELLSRLSEHLEVMLNSEETLMKNTFTDLGDYKQVIIQVNENLDKLAHIQMEEGRQGVLKSKRDMDTIELFTRIEIYFLIGLAVIALLIILYKPKS